MKCKPVILTIFIGLLALAVFLSLSSPLTAQTATDQKDNMQVAQTTEVKKKDAPVKNADYWFDKGALCAT